jgi:NIPSNAP
MRSGNPDPCRADSGEVVFLCIASARRERRFCRRPNALIYRCGCASGRNELAADRAALGCSVITCVVEYLIDPAKIDAFERFARRWIELVDLHGGTHHGYFLPSEGASDKALALFSFSSLAAYEQYRALFGIDPDFIEADRIRDQSGCVLRYERTFMRPVLPEPPA